MTIAPVSAAAAKAMHLLSIIAAKPHFSPRRTHWSRTVCGSITIERESPPRSTNETTQVLFGWL